MNKIITAVLGPLGARETEVLVGRYGLNNSPLLTLAEIGNKYGITRERVRQIEALALKDSRKRLSDAEVKKFIETAVNELKRRGGVTRDSILIEALAKRYNAKSDEPFANAARFIMELSGKMEFRREDNDVHAYWTLGQADEKRAHALVGKLVSVLKSKKEDVLRKGKSIDEYVAELAKSMRLTPAVGAEYVAISKQFMTSPFGQFGLREWSEVNPKTARDWAYIIAKKEGKPLHFTELVKHINNYRNNKITNVQTVHNELIKDNRFVLVGRGIYGLREFGLLPGTAREVLSHFIRREGPLKSKELIQLVLKERFFKEGTLLINLQNKTHFKKLADGRYTLSEA